MDTFLGKVYFNYHWPRNDRRRSPFLIDTEPELTVMCYIPRIRLYLSLFFHFCHFDSFVFCSFLDIIPCFFFLDFKVSSMRSDCRRRIFSIYDTHLFFLFCFRSHFLSISYFFFLFARIPGKLVINDTVMHWESLSLCTP